MREDDAFGVRLLPNHSVASATECFGRSLTPFEANARLLSLNQAALSAQPV